MAWIMLVVAGLLEVGWAISLKYADGFTKLVPSVSFLVLLAGSMALLGAAASKLPIGTAYGVWVGVGAAGTAILGMVLLGDAITPARLAFLGLLIVSVVGLKLAS